MITAESSGEPAWEGPLPEPVRLRVVALASDALGALPPDQVPAALRRYREWAPGRRTRLAATPLALAVERDVTFRQLTYTRACEAEPELASALHDGAPPAAADPVAVAALAYLGRTPGWAGLVEAVEAQLLRTAAALGQAEADAERERLREELAAARAARQEELDRLQAELAAARAEVAELTRSLREEKGGRRRAERAVASAEESMREAEAAAAARVEAVEAELRDVQAERDRAVAALESARAAAREGRNLADSRVRLLLDTVVEAAGGLRRELALPPVADRPADSVAAVRSGDEPGAAVAARALNDDDPAALDLLLGTPQVHLIVDGYNVTKTGYPDLPLEAQRARLVTGLAALAARSGAEVTCCFDGAELQGRVPVPSARGVRVLFSRPGQLADELIRELVRAEPMGRPVVVVSSDREVADGVRRHGARPVPAAALVRRLGRA